MQISRSPSWKARVVVTLRDVLRAAHVPAFVAVALIASASVATMANVDVKAQPSAGRNEHALAHASDPIHDALVRGRDVYMFHCAACHGAAGAGFEEARTAFPQNHRNCLRCHRANNPARMSLEEIDRLGSAFSIGTPPALNGAGLPARFGGPTGLLAYVRATMPRWAPGSLDEADLRDATAYVLALAGALPDDTDLTLDRLFGEP